MTTVAITVVLSWAGWRLLDYQRASNRQRTQEQLGAIIADGKLAAFSAPTRSTSAVLQLRTILTSPGSR